MPSASFSSTAATKPLCPRTGVLPTGVRLDVLSAHLGNGCGDAATVLGPGLAEWNGAGQEGLAALNTAMTRDGVVLDLPAGTKLDKPILVVHLLSGEAGAVHPRNVLRMGAGAEAEIVEVFIGRPGGAGWTNAVLEGAIGQGGHLRHVVLVRHGADVGPYRPDDDGCRARRGLRGPGVHPRRPGGQERVRRQAVRAGCGLQAFRRRAWPTGGAMSTTPPRSPMPRRTPRASRCSATWPTTMRDRYSRAASWSNRTRKRPMPGNPAAASCFRPARRPRTSRSSGSSPTT